MKANVSLRLQKDAHRDGSLKKQIYSFLEKLVEDPALPGLHIEPIQSSVDPRVRTGRVTQMYRAVLFRIDADGDLPHFVFVGVWPHDEAIEVARKSTLTVNPVNSFPQLITATQPAAPTPPPSWSTTAPDVPTNDHSPLAPAGDAAIVGPWLSEVNPDLTSELLVDELGLATDLAEEALSASEDGLLDLAEEAVGWAGLALLDLAAGISLDEVKAKLGVTKADPSDPRTEDERLIASLKTEAARAEFAWLESDEELRAAVEEGDFARWRVFLHPEQRRYAETSYNGSFRLSGGAGTGKTVVLLHRARMLARKNPEARVVLTTFTRTLADALKRDLRLLDPDVTLASQLGDAGVFVTGVDAAANRVLSRAIPDVRRQAAEALLGSGKNAATERAWDSARSWRVAAKAVGEALPPSLRTSAFLSAEYEQVILRGRIATRDAYLRVRRPGRGVALGRKQRAAVWDAVSAYRESAAARAEVDFAEVSSLGALICDQQNVRPADHVLIDEGQDLSAPQWQFLRSLVSDGPNDLFIAEDSQQRIYGQRVILSHLGIRVLGRSRRLTLNYRTTEQVLRFATRILDGSAVVGLEEETVSNIGYRSARRGPQPMQRATDSFEDQLDALAAQVDLWLDEDGVKPESIGILARDQRATQQIEVALEARNLKVTKVEKTSTEASSPQLMTMHRAKGMEFSKVIIFDASRGALPSSRALNSVPDEEHAEAVQRERSLFYVAATRARDELAVTWCGEPSEFLSAG